MASRRDFLKGTGGLVVATGSGLLAGNASLVRIGAEAPQVGLIEF